MPLIDKEKLAAYNKEYRNKPENKKRSKEYQHNRYLENKKNPEYIMKNAIHTAKWREKNPKKAKKVSKKHSDLRIKILSDSYIKAKIADTTNLKYSEIPQDLIDLKRTQLKLKRALKNEKCNITQENNNC